MVLVRSRNPLNIGAAARAMSNFGFSNLRLVNPFHVAFLEARSAVGAADLLARAQEYKAIAEALSDCSLVVGTTAGRDRQLHQPLWTLSEGAAMIRKKMRSGNVALLFGSEKTGLSNDELSYCHWLLHIPTSEKHVSMNLGQAVAVCLYELARKAKIERRKSEEKPITGGELERLTTILFDVLWTSGYFGKELTASKEATIRRLVRRVGLWSADAEVWMGILRQIQWKITHTK